MFAGEFRHTLDAKNRLVISAKFRAFLQADEDRKGFFIMAARDAKCLRLYTMTGWKQLVEKLRQEAGKTKDPAKFMRYFASRGEFSPVDQQKRVTIPQKLLNMVGIRREVLMVGTMDWIEVWEPEEYRASTETLDEEYGSLSGHATWHGPGPASGA